MSEAQRPGEAFMQAVGEAGRILPDADVDAMAAALERLPDDAPPAARRAIAQVVRDASARGLAARLVDSWWREAAHVRPTALALALRAASRTASWFNEHQRADLVWTSAQPKQSVFRRTDQALQEVIEAAEERLLIVSFAAYRDDRVAEALADAACAGVEVRLVLETPKEDGGKVDHDPRRALPDGLRRMVTTYSWPMRKRRRSASGDIGALHVKCAVADNVKLLVSSANLTGYALDINMELGLLVTGGPLPGQVAGHFDALIRDGVLVAD